VFFVVASSLGAGGRRKWGARAARSWARAGASADREELVGGIRLVLWGAGRRLEYLLVVVIIAGMLVSCARFAGLNKKRRERLV
jgi:hypothetical protein